MQDLEGKIAWITGAGTGIGEGAALALARDGAAVVLTGRRKEPLQAVADRIAKAGGRATVRPADVTKAATVQQVADAIRNDHGRLDIVVNNAGMNSPDRTWQRLKAEGADAVIQGNLTSAFYVVQAVLPSCAPQGRRVIIHLASWAGRWRTGVRAGLRRPSTAWWPEPTINLEMPQRHPQLRRMPGEVATPIPAVRSPRRRNVARMISMGNIIAFVAAQPAHVCINEIVVSPTHNRGYIGIMQAREAALAAAGRK
jgi:NADP-dependent 3-hydroxy acid dehydrogenase YdfG